MLLDGWLYGLSLFFMFKGLIADECVKIDSCSCKTKHRTIDFKDLQLEHGKPRFSGIPDQKAADTEYFYNPCLTFTIGTCTDATICQKKGSIYYKLGDATVTFSGDPDKDTLALHYSFTDAAKINRVSTVNVRCSKDLEFTAPGEGPATHYNFELNTKIVCKDDDDDDDLSTGSILLIIFFVFLIIYWLGGFLFLKFYRKAEGVEAIPHYAYWSELPGLIRLTCGMMVSFMVAVVLPPLPISLFL